MLPSLLYSVRQDIPDRSFTRQPLEGRVEPHGQERVAPMVRRNPPKLQSSFAKASEDTRVPPRSGELGILRRRVKRGGDQYQSQNAGILTQYGCIDSELNPIQFKEAP